MREWDRVRIKAAIEIFAKLGNGDVVHPKSAYSTNLCLPKIRQILADMACIDERHLLARVRQCEACVISSLCSQPARRNYVELEDIEVSEAN